MYLNLVQIAESFGVSERVVEGWIRDEGMPHTPDRGRMLFDRAQVVEWATGHGMASQAGFLAKAPSALSEPCHLQALLRTGGIWRDVDCAAVPDILQKIVATIPGVTAPVRQLLAQRMRGPGGVTWAPVGRGLALPHPSARVSLGRDSGTLALIFLRGSLPLDEPTPDEMPVTRLMFFISPTPRGHLELLGRLGRILSSEPMRGLVAEAAADDELYQALAAFDQKQASAFRPEVRQ